MNDNRSETIFFLIALTAAAILAFYVFWPYLNVLILAGTFAVIFEPVYGKIVNFLRGRETIAAFATVLLVLFLVLAPLSFLGFTIVGQATNLYVSLTSGIKINDLSLTVDKFIQNAGQRFHFSPASIDFNEYLRQLVLWLLQNIGPIVASLASVFLYIFLSLLGFFYLLKEGGRFKNKLISLLPLRPEYSEEIFFRLERAVNSVIRGTLMIAAIQGIVAGLGFAIFGVPNAVIWGTLAAITALVPTLGTSLVVVPAVIYLFMSGNASAGFGLIAWGLLAVGLIDNALSPYLMKRGIKIHPFLILLSVLGGISLMGPIGFLTGPLILSLLFALLDIYPVLMLKKRGVG